MQWRITICPNFLQRLKVQEDILVKDHTNVSLSSSTKMTSSRVPPERVVDVEMSIISVPWGQPLKFSSLLYSKYRLAQA